MDDVDFKRENDELDVNAIFRPGIDTTSSPTAFEDLEMGGPAENLNLFKEDVDKEITPPTTPVSERPTRSLALLRSRPFRTRIEKFPDYIYRRLFQLGLPCMCFIINFK